MDASERRERAWRKTCAALSNDPNIVEEMRREGIILPSEPDADLVDRICDVLLTVLVTFGLDPDSEANAYGRQIDDLIGMVNSFRLWDT